MIILFPAILLALVIAFGAMVIVPIRGIYKWVVNYQVEKENEELRRKAIEVIKKKHLKKFGA